MSAKSQTLKRESTESYLVKNGALLCLTGVCGFWSLPHSPLPHQCVGVGDGLEQVTICYSFEKFFLDRLKISLKVHFRNQFCFVYVFLRIVI